MANRKATFAKRQREADLKERAKQKDDRRTQKRGETRDVKGPQIAWDEAVHAVTTDEPPLGSEIPTDDSAGDASDASDDASDVDEPSRPIAPALASVKVASAGAMSGAAGGQPTASPGPAAPRRVG